VAAAARSKCFVIDAAAAAAAAATAVSVATVPRPAASATTIATITITATATATVTTSDSVQGHVQGQDTVFIFIVVSATASPDDAFCPHTYSLGAVDYRAAHDDARTAGVAPTLASCLGGAHHHPWRLTWRGKGRRRHCIGRNRGCCFFFRRCCCFAWVRYHGLALDARASPSPGPHLLLDCRIRAQVFSVALAWRSGYDSSGSSARARATESAQPASELHVAALTSRGRVTAVIDPPPGSSSEALDRARGELARYMYKA
jgi:hypothetical protein